MREKEIYNRRSIRKYKEEALPLELINEVLDADRVAPSGSNRQPWKFLVSTGGGKEKFLTALERGKSTDPRYGYYVNVNTLHALRTVSAVVAVVNPNGKNPFGEVTAQERISEIIDTLSL